MSSLSNKNVVLGVTGGIAAYKSADLVRRLRDANASVKVVMTEAAQQFITPLTMQALSGQPVHTDLLDPQAEAAMGHIELARWADLVLVAPATADFMARVVAGEGPDLLTTLCLATRAAMCFAPAMNQAMWAASATQANVAALRERGVHLLGPASGEQACGDVGLGRMLETHEILAECEKLFDTGALAGKKVVITAGPTREAIDPVRFLSNYSSGKMGYALAEAAVEAGALTTLISGPVHLMAHKNVRLLRVDSALQMHEAALAAAVDADVFIAAAAVADFRPAVREQEKLKKGEGDSLTLELIKNPDIVSSVAKLVPKPFVIGFAAESQNLEENARKKLQEKQLDLVIANDIAQADIGFDSNDNAISILDAHSTERWEKQSKSLLARKLISLIAAKMETTRREA